MLTGLTGRPVLGVLPWRAGPVAGRRGLAGPASRGRARPGDAARPRTCCGSRWSGCRGSATSPTSTRWPPSRACWSGSPPTRPSWPTPTWSCCPAPRATVADLAWLRERGPRRALARAGPARAGRCWASAAATRCSGAASTTTSSRGAGRVAGLGLLPVAGHVRGRQDPGPARRARRYGEPVHGLRDPPRGRRWSTGAGSGAVPGRLPGRVGVGHQLARHAGERRLPPGLPGRGGGAGRAGLPPRAGHLLRRGCGEEQLDPLGDLVEEHLDTAALSRLIEAGPPAGLPVVPPAGLPVVPPAGPALARLSRARRASPRPPGQSPPA